MLIPPNYTPVQIAVPDNNQCLTILDIWQNIYRTNIDTYSYISHISLAVKYNLIYTLIKTKNLKEIKFPYTIVPLISAENIEFYKLNENICLILKEENDILETIDYAGAQFWYKHGILNRDNDLPAVIFNGTQYWFKNGKRHRDNGLPSVIYISGTKAWYKNNKLHRDNDLPAIIYHDGIQAWYKNGKLHRDNNLPAIINTDGTQLWYQNGVRYDYPS